MIKGEKINQKNTAFARSCCPITNALDLFGDKWTLLIIRDLMVGKKRYLELIASAENISSNILADRLKKLLKARLITRRAYQQKPARYEYCLTEKGESLRPVLTAISMWGQKYYPGIQLFTTVNKRDSV
jgi:DNA-binding HxlR family transcriptional regulator